MLRSEQIQARNYDTWIRPLSLLSVEEGHVMLGVPNAFFQDWVETHYKPAIEACTASEREHSVKVGFTIQLGSQENLTTPASTTPVPPETRPRMRAAAGLNH